MTSASERASPHSADRVERSSRLRDQAEELTAPVRAAAQVVQVKARRQLERLPARSQGSAKPLRRLVSGASASRTPKMTRARANHPSRSNGKSVPHVLKAGRFQVTAVSQSKTPSMR